MLNKRELLYILAATLVLGFLFSLAKTWQTLIYFTAIVFLVIIINIVTKKITAHYYDSSIEVKLWEIQRYGFHPRSHFKNPIPAGIIMPILITVFSAGYLVWSACLTFDIKAKAHRAAKRYGPYTFSEVSEYHTGIIAASGIIANLVFAIIGYLIGMPDFARVNIIFAAFNILPFSDLDGNKIFFANIVLWSLIAAVTLVGVGYLLLLV